VSAGAAPPRPERVRTARLVLQEVSVAEAAELVDGRTAARDWLGGSPGEGTREGAGMVLRAAEAGYHSPGWGLYVIVRREDGAAVGGIGFHGPPADGSVEIGFDLVSPGRGHGYATESLGALADTALHRPGVDRVVATAARTNEPSQRVMLRAGFTLVGPDDLGSLLTYELTLPR